MPTARLKFLATLCVLLLIAAPALGDAPPGHDLLAASFANRVWLAQVGPPEDPGLAGSSEATRLQVRAAGTGDSWVALPPVAGRAVSLGRYGNDLAVLLQSGDWVLVSADDRSIRVGPPPPDPIHLMALAGDDGAVWAVASATGEAIARLSKPATQPATTQSTSAPAAPGAERPSAIPSMVAATMPMPHPVLIKLGPTGWVLAARLPEDLPLTPGQLSLSVIDGSPSLAYVSSERQVHILRIDASGSSHEVGALGFDQPVVDFNLLDTPRGTLLWVGKPKGAGVLVSGTKFENRTELALDPKAPPAESRTATVAAERIRVLWRDDKGKAYEQAYDFDGSPVGNVTTIGPAADWQGESQWTGILVLAAFLAFAAAAVRRNGGGATATADAAEAKLPLASITSRISAGLIDLTPFIIALVLVRRQTAGMHALNAETAKHLAIVFSIGLGIYLLHVTVAELITGTSIGKFLFGLRVVDLQGGKAKPSALLLRNALRVIDLLFLPLALLVLSPLRQRLGDLMAGTVVITKRKEPDNPEEAS